MSKLTGVKGIAIGCGAGIALLPACAALLAAIALKNGDTESAVTSFAVTAAAISGFTAAFLTARLCGNALSGLLTAGILTLLLSVSALALNDGNGIFTVPLAMAAGGAAAFSILLFWRKKAKPHRRGKKTRKK